MFSFYDLAAYIFHTLVGPVYEAVSPPKLAHNIYQYELLGHQTAPHVARELVEPKDPLRE